MQWCPRCHGVLVAPVRSDVPLPPPPYRGFRWVARTPLRRGTLRIQAVRPTPTPRYQEIPRWGLDDRAVAAARTPEPHPDFWGRAASYAPALLITVASLYGLAVLAEALRYGILVRNRHRLIDPTLLSVSDAAVVVTQTAALLAAVCAAVACVGWLIGHRREVFAREHTVDPRSPAALATGCLVPVVNLVMPGLFLLETVRRDPGAVRLVRAWWAVWLLDGFLVVAGAVWRFRTSLQAIADGVVLAGFTALVAAATALLTLAVLRRLEQRDVFGAPRHTTRWIVSVDGLPTPAPYDSTGPGAAQDASEEDAAERDTAEPARAVAS
ncbi:DUF4328 domain-containing protein [Rhodococcus sp. HNM0569]|uniref:DUF4328 domain-containing protein n=1 Tax=Rhodococcus sp. HNM0569 TaxID=2716340 RepID=UPI001F0D00B1|nr:DUF4328 domain-containing protein [Rhodococcus sp. HNM0569]